MTNDPGNTPKTSSYKTFYVSLTRDLLGHYLMFSATSEEAVRQYIRREYHRDNTWTLPWCAIYEEIPDCGAIIIKARCGHLHEEA